MTLAWSTITLDSVQPASMAAVASRIGKIWRWIVNMVSVGRSELEDQEIPQEKRAQAKARAVLAQLTRPRPQKTAESRGFIAANCGEIGAASPIRRDSEAGRLTPD